MTIAPCPPWREVEADVRFFVVGIPAPGGSKTAFRNKHTGKIVVVDSAKRNKPWREAVAWAAREAMGERAPMRGALVLDMLFTFPRPKGHYGSGRNEHRVREGAPPHHVVKPDCLKTARSTEDAMTGIVYVDDSQVHELRARKVYGDHPGVLVEVRRA